MKREQLMCSCRQNTSCDRPATNGGAARLLSVLMVTLCLSGLRADADDMRWERAEKEVAETLYPAEFVDSLKDAKGIGRTSALRNYGKLPFEKREKLVFDGGWGFIRAGFGILTAAIDDSNSSVFNVSGKVVTNNFVSAFYKVRDFVHVKIDRVGLYPLFFQQHLREGSYRAHHWTLYDHATGRVFTHKDKEDEPDKEITPFSHGYVSILYYLRTLDLQVGKTYTIPCYVHKKDHPIEFKVEKREKIEVEAGRFKTLKVRPKLVGEGRGFTKNDKMYIWLTDDKYHMPVKLKAKAALGSLSATLLRYERE
jgi:hypothetical protein